MASCSPAATRWTTTTSRSSAPASTISSNPCPVSIWPVSGDPFDWFDRFGDVMLRFDAAGRFVYGNPAATEMLGGRVDPGAPWETLLESVAPGLPERIRGAAPGAVEAHGFWRGHVKLTDASGHGDLF